MNRNRNKLSWEARKCITLGVMLLICIFFTVGGILSGLYYGKSGLQATSTSVDHVNRTADLAGPDALMSSLMFGVAAIAIFLAYVTLRELLKATTALNLSQYKYLRPQGR